MFCYGLIYNADSGSVISWFNLEVKEGQNLCQSVQIEIAAFKVFHITRNREQVIMMQ